MKGSGYIYVTVTFFKSHVLFLTFLGLQRNSLILFLIPEPIYPKPSPYNSFYFGLFFMQSRKYSLSYVTVAIFT